MGYFKRKADASLRRGMRQAACVVISRQPYYDIYEPFLADGMLCLCACACACACVSLFVAIVVVVVFTSREWGEEG